jgi:hypothetical protein
MSSDLTLKNAGASTSLDLQMRWAKAAAGSGILPKAYRDGNAASILVAISLGASMGLTPAESLYRIDVIQGTPTAKAELIMQNVRRAGHRIRVTKDATAMSATATIVRADDPDFEWSETRDMEWARHMGLATKENYKSQPLTMLAWRAVTAVARLACPEALYGVVYDTDELREARPVVDDPEPAAMSSVERVRQALRPVEDIVDAEVVDTAAPITPDQLAQIKAGAEQAGLTPADGAALVEKVSGRKVGTKELTEAEADDVLAALTDLAEQAKPADDEWTVDADTGELFDGQAV